ncbi:MAG: RDD family protein [Chloroflexi bacterium]|nr:RDD family protein [Chloroflexota bacterium]
MEYVSVGRRAVATIVDTAVLFVFGYVVGLATGGTTAEGFELQGAPALLTFLLWFVYYIAMEAMVGATLGKLLLGLKVVKADGSPMDWPASLIRNVLRIVDGIVLYLIGAILVWQSPRRQRLGDRVAGTVVIRRSARAVEAPVAQQA